MKQNTKNRKRRLTAAEKKLANMAGLKNPKAYLFAGESDRYLFLVSKLDGSRIPVPKNPFTAT